MGAAGYPLAVDQDQADFEKPRHPFTVLVADGSEQLGE